MTVQRFQFNPKGLLQLSIAMACGLNAGLAQASGFALIEQSASGQGLSYAGAAANAEDASVMWFNAAGLTDIEGNQGIVAAHVILPKNEFTSSSGASDDPSTTGVVPNLYWKGQVGDYALGFGLNVPYGQKLEYSDDWTGRYHALKTDLKSVNLNANIAKQLTQNTSLGFGLNAMQVDLEMTAGTSPTTEATIKADSWGYGYNIGLLSKFGAAGQLGLAYRSEVVQNATGTFSSGGSSQKITSDVTLPATASLSLSQGFGNNLTLLADATWTNWNAYDELVIKTSSGAILSETNQNFKDSMRYSVGMIYAYNDKWKLRTGLAYDETPVPDAQSRSPRTPDSNKTWASFGFNYQFTPAMSMDFGYSHLFADKAKINKTAPTLLVGEYETSVDILSAQLVWNY